MCSSDLSLSCVKGNRVLFDRLDLSIGAGQAYQITGPNGAGKTSLLRILCGLSRPEEGEVFWQGQPIDSDPGEFRSALSYIGHAPGIKLDLTARENLMFAAALLPCANGVTVEEALGRVGLQLASDLICRHLSAGQHRRVAIARLYLTDAKLWILDEPLAAIDQDGIRTVSDLIDAHLDRGGLAVLTSHQALDLRRHPIHELNIG